MRFAPGAALALALAACGPSPEAVERGRVLVALDRVRDAPSDDVPGRRRLLDDLQQTPAAVPEVARARDTCAAAYRSLLDGTELQNGVRAELEKGSPGSSLAARLVEAEADIKRSEAAMPDCERAIAGLRLPGRH